MASSSALVSHISCPLRVLSDVRGSERVRRARATIPFCASSSEASTCAGYFQEDERRTRCVKTSSPRDVNRRSVLIIPASVLATLACFPLPGRAADVYTAQDVDILAPQVPARKRVLVLGATGRVGSATVLSLLGAGHDVRAVVRNVSSLPQSLSPFIEPRGPGDSTGRLVLIESSISSMSIPAMADAMRGCDAVVQALGHRLTLDGVYGEPRFLCRDAAALVFNAWDTLEDADDPSIVNFKDTAGAPDPAATTVDGPDTRQSVPVAGARKPKRFVLLASAGADNPAGTDPTRSIAERAFIEALAKVVPPFADTLAEVDLVSSKVGDGASSLQWTVVRPDDFLDETTTPTETRWVLHERLQNGLSDAGLSSVVNIGACMAALAIGDETLWREWAGKMPQVLDDPQPSGG